MTNIVKGADYHMVSINNIRTKDEVIEGVSLRLHIMGTKAVFMTPEGDLELEIKNGTVQLPPITDGGMLYIH